MSKKIISAILSLSLILSFFTFALAEDNPGITAYEGNVYTVGVSQIFFFENIFPTEVYVNNELISDYDISSKMRKLYIHGSIFDNAGTYSVMISDGDIEAVTDITVSDNTEVYEYSIDGTYDKGSLINPSSTAGAEHSALGSQGGRKPIIVRTITSSQIPNLWVRWDITNTGRFSIDYWCPKYYVCCPVTVTVQDKNGVHTFENLLAEEQTAKYVTLSEDGTNPYIFDFTGNGEYYLQVSPFQAKVNFIVDSFKMYGFAAEHNLESPYVTSDVYSIDGDTINGVLFHTAENDIIKNIDIPADCVYELESDGEFINMGDSFIVKKIFDESICNIYSFGKVLYISSQKYTIDDINSEILQIPYGETYEDFMSGIVHNELVTIKIFDGDSEKTDGCISDTDVLQIYVNNALKETFKLSVIPPSNENTIFSELY